MAPAQPYFVSPSGNDTNPGSLERPFATLQCAQQAVRQKRGDVFLRGGTYYLPATLVFTAEDSGTKDAPVVFQNYQDEKPVISGGVRLEQLDWPALHQRNISGAGSAGFADRGNFHQRRAADSGAIPELRSAGAILRRVHLGSGHQTALHALGGSRRRLFARDAPGAVGGFHLAFHWKRYQRRLD